MLASRSDFCWLVNCGRVGSRDNLCDVDQAYSDTSGIFQSQLFELFEVDGEFDWGRHGGWL